MQTAPITDDTTLVPLTGSQRNMLAGLVSHFRHSMLLDLRKGALTETGIRDYRQSLAEAGEIMGKLGGAA